MNNDNYTAYLPFFVFDDVDGPLLLKVYNYDSSWFRFEEDQPLFVKVQISLFERN